MVKDGIDKVWRKLLAPCDHDPHYADVDRCWEICAIGGALVGLVRLGSLVSLAQAKVSEPPEHQVGGELGDHDVG